MALKRITQLLLIPYGLLTFGSIAAIAAGAVLPDFITPLSTLIGSGFALLHAGQREGWKRALALLGLVFGISLLFESLGVATGWVYGPYHYTARLGPLFLGLVPLLIPAAWFMMMYPSLVVAEAVLPSGGRRWPRALATAAVAGMVMTAWDLTMDPIMVGSGYWVWQVHGAYFGIPLQNFWGWWLTSFVTLALYLAWSGRVRQTFADFDRPALASYAVTCLGSICLSMLFNAGIGLVGIFAQSPWVIAGWLKMLDNGE
jgi:putative membrane protein